MGKLYQTRFQTNTAQKPSTDGAAHTYIAYIREYPRGGAAQSNWLRKPPQVDHIFYLPRSDSRVQRSDGEEVPSPFPSLSVSPRQFLARTLLSKRLEQAINFLHRQIILIRLWADLKPLTIKLNRPGMKKLFIRIYWPSVRSRWVEFSFAFSWTDTKSRSINTPKRRILGMNVYSFVSR